MACGPYILICAGEDSGDSIGAPLVKTLVSQNFAVKGSGGRRMQAAGMLPLVDFETLPVSGFGDVLPKYFKLRESFNALKSALESPECLGLIAIDYPGFNMKLVARAGELRKPALYVAPPQVWAWKRKRAKVLAENPYVKLAVFFDFEESVYREAGCNVVRVKHPFAEIQNADCRSENFLNENLRDAANQVLLLPGSRKAQALRNLPIYLKALENAENVVVVAARQELVKAFEKYDVPVIVAPQSAAERMALYQSAEYALTAPGTSTLELALSGASFTVCTKPDLLTYCLGRLFIKTKFFALPNIILNRLVFSEHIVPPWSGVDAWSFTKVKKENVAKELSEKLSVGKSFDQLALEFLGQFVERKSQ
jgi:lipid-A-disaccharide synthase